MGILAAALMGVNACASFASGGARIGPASQERPWRTYLGSPGRAPAGTDSVGVAPRELWRVDVGRGIAGSPALTEDVVAVAQVDRQVTLLSRATGERLWRARFPTSPGAGPLVDGTRLFVATQERGGHVYALRLSNGERLWSRPAGDVAAPLAMDGDVVFAGTTTGTVLALRASDGRPVWRVELPGAVRAAPVPTAAGLVVATATDSLFLLDARTGAVRVRRAVRGSVIGSPAAAEGLLVVGTTAGELEALRPDSLAPAWRRDLGTPVVGNVALQDGVAWALGADGELWRVPVADPDAASHVASAVISRAGPLPTASGVFLAGANGDLALVDPATGVHRWTAHVQAPLDQPPLVDGRFFLATAARGTVVAFR